MSERIEAQKEATACARKIGAVLHPVLELGGGRPARIVAARIRNLMVSLLECASVAAHEDALDAIEQLGELATALHGDDK
jgi:hypothetical protein